MSIGWFYFLEKREANILPEGNTKRNTAISKSVFYIKLVHSALFFLIAVSALYVLVAALLDQITILTWVAFGIVVIELVVLILNNWQCPLTIFAENRGAVSGSVADLFLPKWLADHLFAIFGVLFGMMCVLLAWRVWDNL